MKISVLDGQAVREELIFALAHAKDQTRQSFNFY